MTSATPPSTPTPESDPVAKDDAPRTNGAAAAAAADQAPGAQASPGNDLAAALTRAQAEAADYKDQFLRARADAENARRRAQDEVSKAHKFGIENFAESLLPVKDSLEAALAVQNATMESYRDGIEITLRQLTQAFARNHLQDIAPGAGEKFDPNRHQAISMVPSDVPAQHVVSMLQKGYLIADRVLRPALVTVSQGQPVADATPPAGETT